MRPLLCLVRFKVHFIAVFKRVVHEFDTDRLLVVLNSLLKLPQIAAYLSTILLVLDLHLLKNSILIKWFRPEILARQWALDSRG